MGLAAAIVLSLGLIAYVLWPEKRLVLETPKGRLEWMRERRDVVFDNLRDLNFEFRSGKYPAEDYASQREQMEEEAATIVAEIDRLEAALPPQP